MNKTLLIVLIILIIIFAIGGGLGWYFYFKEKKSKSTASTCSAPEKTTSESTTSQETTQAEEGKTIKDVHCLQNPKKGTNIIVNNLTDYQVARSPLTFSGYANVFEGQVQYRLKDCRGPILKEGYTTAEGEIGTNPPFSETISFELSRSPMDAILEVFEISQADGSEVNLFQVPLRLTN